MFVRTKDKIIKVDETGYIKEIDVCGNKCLFLFNKNFLYGREVIKQAETIEELCDEIVGVDKTCKNGHQLLRAFPYKCANFWNGGVYGAIWTDTGLIYVAKMNERGELELLCQN